jgi:membrane protease YdiL (CAAX protease family)
LDSYRLAIVIVFAIGAHSLAAHVHSRWLGTRGVGYSVVYIGVMALTVAFGFTVFSVDEMFGGTPLVFAISLCAGLALGAIAARSDRAIVRYFGRRARLAREGQLRPAHGSAGVESRVLRVETVPTVGAIARRRPTGVPIARQTISSSTLDRRSGPAPFLAVAALEEMIHRGLLVQACVLLSSTPVEVAALMGCAVLFALVHVSFGWAQVIGKLPLSVVATVAVLAFGSLVVAIVAHSLFNLRIWRDWRHQPRLEHRETSADPRTR